MEKNHFKSIKIAYQSSPYFEFYEDDLMEFYRANIDNLYKLNLNSVKLVLKWLELDYLNNTIDFNYEEYSNSLTIKKLIQRKLKTLQTLSILKLLKKKMDLLMV